MVINSSSIQQKKQKVAKLVKANKLQEAKLQLEKICKADKHDFEAWFFLSTVCGQLGRPQEAINACHQAIALNPRHAASYSNLGNALSLIGRHQEAMDHYTKSLQLEPNNATTHYNIGNSLYLMGQLTKAAEQFQKAIDINPAYANAYLALGNISRDQGFLTESTKHCSQALTIDPNLVKAYLTMGMALSDFGRIHEAEEYFRKGLVLEPNNIELHFRLALVLRYQGRLDDALACYKTIDSIDPGSAIALSGEAETYERKGKIEESYKRLCMLIEKNNINATVVDVFTRMCRKYNRCDEAIDLGDRLLKHPDLPSGEKQLLHYSLGKLHDKLHNYDLAFSHYHNANELSHYHFDPESHIGKIDQLISYYSTENFSNFPHSNVTSDKPIFIVGMPRSGTTLVEQIISSHPMVCGAGELNDINDIANSIHLRLGHPEQYPICLPALTQEIENDMAQQYLNHLDTFGDTEPYVTDKMPNNFMHLGLINLLFPDAKIIHCKRDPLDTCLSIFFQSFSGVLSFATNLRHLGVFYRQYERLMEHWKQVITAPILEIQYENLVLEQEKYSRDLIDFCGLEWDDRCLQFHKSKRKVATASYDQVRKPIYTKSICRWKNYEKHLDDLKAALAQDN